MKHGPGKARGRVQGFFQRRVAHLDLPFEDHPWWLKKVILNSLSAAWHRLLDEEPLLAAESAETDVTACLQQFLEELRHEPGQPAGFGSLFETVVREGSEVNYDGTRLEKKPDLAIRLRNRYPGWIPSLHRATFVECKIVSRSHPIRRYCAEGIVRFVRGDYAWAMPSALMVAYRRDGITLSESLLPHLSRQRAASPDPYSTRSLPAPVPELAGCEPPVYASRHDRSWTYPRGNAPGPIELLHLWLPAPPPPAE